VTVNVAVLALDDPPALAHVSVKVVVPDVVSVNVSVPLVAIVPFQPPEEKQLVALTDDQVRVTGDP
jgi:hypothetical protein